MVKRTSISLDEETFQLCEKYEVMEIYRHKAVKNVRRTRGKINLDDLISRNNLEFAMQKIDENNVDYEEENFIDDDE